MTWPCLHFTWHLPPLSLLGPLQPHCLLVMARFNQACPCWGHPWSLFPSAGPSLPCVSCTSLHPHPNVISWEMSPVCPKENAPSLPALLPLPCLYNTYHCVKLQDLVSHSLFPFPSQNISRTGTVLFPIVSSVLKSVPGTQKWLNNRWVTELRVTGDSPHCQAAGQITEL